MPCLRAPCSPARRRRRAGLHGARKHGIGRNGAGRVRDAGASGARCARRVRDRGDVVGGDHHVAGQHRQLLVVERHARERRRLLHQLVVRHLGRVAAVLRAVRAAALHRLAHRVAAAAAAGGAARGAARAPGLRLRLGLGVAAVVNVQRHVATGRRRRAGVDRARAGGARAPGAVARRHGAQAGRREGRRHVLRHHHAGERVGADGDPQQLGQRVHVLRRARQVALERADALAQVRDLALGGDVVLGGRLALDAVHEVVAAAQEALVAEGPHLLRIVSHLVKAVKVELPHERRELRRLEVRGEVLLAEGFDVTDLERRAVARPGGHRGVRLLQDVAHRLEEGRQGLLRRAAGRHLASASVAGKDCERRQPVSPPGPRARNVARAPQR
mmetsp:Transcript_984/g.3111  ORF Transcript_984/g.3111 Transcript_984/m.3111 type:complete len:387 (+) Transcript_984:1180-2340(+)